MRVASFQMPMMCISLLFACGACGGDDGPPPNPGFVAPAAATRAHAGGEDLGPADWSCLGAPSVDRPTAVDVTLSGTLRDFQVEERVIEGGTIRVFAGAAYQDVLDEAGPTDATGAFTLRLPAGIARYGFTIEAPEYKDTFLLNQAFDPEAAEQTQDIRAISQAVADLLPLAIGLEPPPDTGVLAGAIRDCADRAVANAVATVSSRSGGATHLRDADTYYLSGAAGGLPAAHESLLHTDATGLFAVFQLPPTDTAYIQVWGFVDDADLADGEMTLLAELASPVLADTVITGSIDPLRAPE